MADKRKPQFRRREQSDVADVAGQIRVPTHQTPRDDASHRITQKRDRKSPGFVAFEVPNECSKAIDSLRQ